MVNRCPYCYRLLDTWINDPILLPNGAKYKFIDDTHLELVSDEAERFYKGFTSIGLEQIKELQDNRKELEEELLTISERTEFTELNDTGNFQVNETHIKELRKSTEKLLDAVGLTKEDYFNYDEEGNEIIHPIGKKTEWIDPIDLDIYNPNNKLADNFQIKAVHIEDLRHNIPIGFLEKWNKDFQIVQSYAKVKLDPTSSFLPIVEYNNPLPIYLNPNTSIEKWECVSSATLTWVTQTISTWILGSGFSEVLLIGDEINKQVKFHMVGSNTDMTPVYGSYAWLRGLRSAISPFKGVFKIPLKLKITTNLCVGFENLSYTLPLEWDGNTVYGNVILIKVFITDLVGWLTGGYYTHTLFYFLRPVDFVIPGKENFATNCIGLTEFTRNLYNDFTSAYGMIPANKYILDMEVHSSLSLGMAALGSWTQDVSLDNIKIKPIAEPDITPATEGG